MADVVEMHRVDTKYRYSGGGNVACIGAGAQSWLVQGHVTLCYTMTIP